MSPRWRVWLIAALSAAVLIAAIYFPFLRRRVKKEQNPQPSEERVRQELTEPVEENAANPRVKTTLFWAADENDSGLAPVTVDLPLSNDPAMRAKQVLNTLVAGPVDADLRTLPPDAVLLAFYLLPDGTGIADFSEALATSTPSGIQSEQLAVDSIARTLEANVPQVKRLKILIHGQEMDTLAGHVDLTQTFVVDTKAAAAPATAVPSAQPAAATPANPAGKATPQTTAAPHP
ncbi:MAG TPA: GerMN domain-containing protein [Candidatus Acidoferrum sp.]|nr:GerMN domain-containing protein [Candidatus Acidoferrum sp.]